MKRQTIEITSVKQLQNFEIVNSNVSKKYVPIFSSELIEGLKPEFTFIGGMKFNSKSSAHYITLLTEEGDTLRIYNSYDRSMALRVNLVSDGMLIPLGIDRLIHMGEKAKHFKEDFTAAKNEIKEAVVTAKVLDTKLSEMAIEKDVAEALTKTIFRFLPEKEQAKVEVKNPVDVLIGKPDVSIKEYIKKSITNYLTGEYQYVKDGKTFKGPRKNSVTTRIRTENFIVKTLKETNPELFL